MAYIGNQIATGSYRKLSNISAGFNGSTTTFQLSVPPGTAQFYVTPTSVYQLLISVGGVIQNPDTDYTLNGSQIVFTTAPASGLSFFGIQMGDALNVGTPSDGTVTTAKLDSTGIAPVVTSLNGGALAGARNRIINGDMRIDQRNAGAAVTVDGNFPLDRFQVTNITDGSFSSSRSTVAPAAFTNSLYFTTTVADASLSATQRCHVKQSVEGFNVADLAWGTASAASVTISFWVRSSLTGTFGGAVQNVTPNRSYPFSYTITLANTWEQKSITIPGDTTGTWAADNTVGIAVIFGLGVGSTYSGTAGAWAAADYRSATGATSVVGTNGATFYITGVQLEPGSVATPFERRSYGQELALCQRYYQRLGGVTGSVYSMLAVGNVQAGGTTAYAIGRLTQTMRSAPTFNYSGALGTDLLYNVTGNATPASLTLDQATPDTFSLTIGVSATAGYCARLFTITSTGSTNFSAEL